MNRREEFIRFLLDCQALKFGSFTLKSGRSSPFFINLGSISSGKDLEFLGDNLAETLHEGFPEVTSLFGPAYKGIALATAVATAFWRRYQKNLAVFYDRKEAKDHGEGGSYIGALPAKDARVVIVDDVISDGATKTAAIENLQKAFGVDAAGVLVAVDRTLPGTRPAFSLRPIITLNDLFLYLQARGDPNAALMKSFMEASA